MPQIGISSRAWGKRLLIVLISALLFALLALWGTSNQYTGKLDMSFSIRRAPERNSLSSGNEVWFQAFARDGEVKPAASLGVPAGWREYKGYLQIVSGDSTVESLHVRCLASNMELYLYHSPAGGILLLENEAGQEQRIDLYAEESYYEYVPVRLTFSAHQPEGTVWFFVVALGVGLFLGSLIAFVSRKLVAILPVLLAFFLFYYEQVLFNDWAAWLAALILSVGAGVACVLSLHSDRMARYRRPGALIGISLVSVYAAFALVGHPLILQAYSVTITRYTLAYWLLLSVWMFFLVIAVLWCLEQLGRWIWQDRTQKPLQGKWRFWALFGVCFGIGFLWLIACWPVNMPSDGMGIWQIIHGDMEYWTGHPYFYYQSVNVLSHIWDNPTFVVIVQNAFFSFVSAAFTHYLCKKGLSFPFAMVFILLFALIPSNGIGQATLLKDYPQATALLWLTYLLVQLIWDREQAVTPKNMAALVAALLMCALYRSNGVIAFVLVILYLWCSVRRYRKKLKWIFRSVVCGTVAVWIAMNSFVNVLYGGSGASGILEYMILDNIAGVAASGDTLSENSMQIVEEYASWEDWADFYSPYNAPTGLAKLPFVRGFMEGKTTLDLAPLLVDSIVRAPLITLKTRLNKVNIMWSLAKVPGQQNLLWVWIAPNDYGIERPVDNPLYHILMQQISENRFFWRICVGLFFYPGLYLILLFIMAIKLCCGLEKGKRRKKKMLWGLLPLAGNLLSLFVSSQWQDFRYFYFVIPLSLCFLLTGVIFDRAETQQTIAETACAEGQPKKENPTANGVME